MKNLYQDSKALDDTLTDFSNQYGDQALIEVVNEWLEEKMGNYAIHSAHSCRMSQRAVLSGIADTLQKEADKTKFGAEYLMGLTKAMLEITRKIFEL